MDTSILPVMERKIDICRLCLTFTSLPVCLPLFVLDVHLYLNKCEWPKNKWLCRKQDLFAAYNLLRARCTWHGFGWDRSTIMPCNFV